jgi:hypothetical protein
MKNNIILLTLIGALVTACGSGSSNSSTTPQTPAQQFATNITQQSIQLAQLGQSLELVAFESNLSLAYLFTTKTNNATSYLYSFNGTSWSQSSFNYPSSFVPYSILLSNAGMYFGGENESGGVSKAALYLYKDNNWQLIESNPYLQNCTNYCYIKTLINSADGSSIYVSGIDDKGTEVYKYNGTWTALPAPPLAAESAYIPPMGGWVFLLNAGYLAVDNANNLYLGATYGTYKGPYEGYLAKFTNGSWVQESLPQQFSWSVNGLTYNNSGLYAAGRDNAYYGAPTSEYSVSVLNNEQWNKLYSYIISESSQYDSPVGIYSDTYGNIYSQVNQSGVGEILVLSLPAQ